MADTDTETLPNGTATLSAEEEERLKQRPADIDADVREMERRKRVEAIMSSKLFREELERVLDQQMHEGNDAPLLQRIREMVGGRLSTGSLRGPSCMLPINDIRGIEGVGYEKGEKILRCKLAAVYRLVDLFGWTQSGIPGQITARLNTAVEQVLTTPRGLLPHEVTASSLVKLDMQGAVQDQGTTNFPVNVDGFALHAAVHAARPDVRCVLHVRSAAALALSASRGGVLPLCAEAALLGEVGYHRAAPGAPDAAERDRLVRALGPHAKVLVLSGAGALCCGATLEEAFYHARMLALAADVQLRLAALPRDELLLLGDDERRQLYEASRKPPSDAAKWRVGGEEFEALMRMMDNAGFRTGHVYRQPLVKNDVPKPRSDVEVPPAVSSLGYLLEEEELYRQGLWKKGGKSGERTRWLNSPNVYQKVELLETGTSDPKRITKWVQDGSPAHSTPVRIDTLQFVPKNTNPKEFKQLQQQIKENRRADKISAGPQSHILEGVARDDARLLPEDAAGTHTGDHVILMGAASKGIIQRGYQHNASMYSAPYARNPFDHVTDTDIDEYRRVVERKQRGHDYDTDISESEALSAPQRSAPDTEDESREEQRVLRIETKQVPVMSQPEVVLSDVDAADFLNAERDHADRTRGTREARTHEALSSHKRSLHKYSRNPNIDSTIHKYNTVPKCKTGLNKLTSSNCKLLVPYSSHSVSSRSSLLSMPSIDSDRCRNEFPSHSRSLSRRRRGGELYRTRSHSGFINSYIQDPEPEHYHLPKCISCGSTTSSRSRYSSDEMRYLSCDDIGLKCSNQVDFEPLKVTVKQNTVPVFRIPNQEFVDSQEFNEDNYLGDIGHSFSTDTQTVVEKMSTTNETQLTDDEIKQNTTAICHPDEIYRAVFVRVDDDADTDDGEYHSFTDDIDFEEAVYESPVKKLVEKDIRDYSVPIDFYCEGYSENDARKLSSMKTIEITKPNTLEPILEESKTSSDNSCTDSNKTIILNDTVLREVVDEFTTGRDKKIANSTENLVHEKGNVSQPAGNNNVVRERFDSIKMNERIDNNRDGDSNIQCEMELTKTEFGVSSLSAGSSATVQSFDSTAEFEKYEIIADVISAVLTRFECSVFVDNKEQTHGETRDSTSYDTGKCNEEYSLETFSITEMVKDYEKYERCNDTVLDESNQSEANYSHGVAEAVVYYIFDRAVYLCDKKIKKKLSKYKKVITVVDCEDIIYTTLNEWLYLKDASNNGDDVKMNEDRTKNEPPVYHQTVGNQNTNTSDLNKGNLKNKEVEVIEECSGDSICYDEMSPNATFVSESVDGSFTYYDNYVHRAADNAEVAGELIDELLERSLCDATDMTDTFVGDREVMNTAFVDSDFYNRSSSPQRNVFVCTESPIKRNERDPNDSLYYKDIDSPFIKKANILSMSQRVHSGGIKYWLSFDDNLVLERPLPRTTRKYTENKQPSFLVLDFDNKGGTESERAAVLVDSRSVDEAEISTSNYNTCESSRFEACCDEKLIYDTRAVRGKRILYSTWPPYDDALFYRIISKFRLTDSFDLSQLEKRCGSF